MSPFQPGHSYFRCLQTHPRGRFDQIYTYPYMQSTKGKKEHGVNCICIIHVKLDTATHNVYIYRINIRCSTYTVYVYSENVVYRYIINQYNISYIRRTSKSESPNEQLALQRPVKSSQMLLLLDLWSLCMKKCLM